MINTDFRIEFEDDLRPEAPTTDDAQVQTGLIDGAPTETTDVPLGDVDLAFGFDDGVQLQLFPGQGFDSGFLSFL